METRISYIVDALGKMEEVLKRQAELDERRASSKKEQEERTTSTRRVRKISGSESGSDHQKAPSAAPALPAPVKADKQRDSSAKPRKKKPRKDSSSGEDSDDGAATKNS